MSGKDQTLAVVIPCHNEADNIVKLVEAIGDIRKQIEGEAGLSLLFVDDGSTDDTIEVIRKQSGDHPWINWLSFSRNFGKEAALYAGLLNSTDKDYIAVMDADFQDPPEMIAEMIGILDEHREYDCVGSFRTTRKGEPVVRSFFANAFYRIINKVSGIELKNGARDFRIMRKDMVEAILSMAERNRFSKGLFEWVGFNTYWLPYENIERQSGKTSWSFMKLVAYSISGIINFSSVPLALISIMGLICTFLSFVFLLVVNNQEVVGRYRCHTRLDLHGMYHNAPGRYPAFVAGNYRTVYFPDI